MRNSLPSFQEEVLKWKENTLVIGVDEVGRGAFAGPLVAGAVAFHIHQKIPSSVFINDSKRLSPRQREKSSHWIKANVFSWGIGQVSVPFINKRGIVKATQKAFRQAIQSLLRKNTSSDVFILVDAFHIPYLYGIGKFKQKAIVKGDQKSLSIAAASIIAKVYRDMYMITLSKKVSQYGWEKNKGYGTENHREAIKNEGVSIYHRFDFVKDHV